MSKSWIHAIEWYLKISAAQVFIITITSAATVIPSLNTSTSAPTSAAPTTTTTTTTEITTNSNAGSQDDDSDEVAGLRAGLIVMSIIAIIAIGIIVAGVVLKIRKRRRQQQKRTDSYVPNYSNPIVYGKDKKIANASPPADEQPSAPTQDYENTNPGVNAIGNNSSAHNQVTSQVSVEGDVYEDFTTGSNRGNNQQAENPPDIPAPAPPKQNKDKDAPESTDDKNKPNPDLPDVGTEMPGEMIYQNEDDTQRNNVYSPLDNSPTYDHTYMPLQKSD